MRRPYQVQVQVSKGTLTAVPISRKIGERNVLFVSLYACILSTGLSALVPNYYSVLLSRAFIGYSVGLNSCVIGVFVSKYSSGKYVTNIISFISGKHFYLVFFVYWGNVLPDCHYVYIGRLPAHEYRTREHVYTDLFFHVLEFAKLCCGRQSLIRF